MNELIDEMIKEFEESKGGHTSFIFDDGDEYHTDTGYAMEGINAFAERLNKRLMSMTNGEVIEAMFPNDSSAFLSVNMDRNDWWNAPYKAESEDKE